MAKKKDTMENSFHPELTDQKELLEVKEEELEPVFDGPPLEQVPYEQHIIPTNGDGLLSGMLDFIGEIAKDSVGLTKAIASDTAQLGKEIMIMVQPKDILNQDIPLFPEDQEKSVRRQAAELQWQQLTRHHDATHSHDLDR